MRTVVLLALLFGSVLGAGACDVRATDALTADEDNGDDGAGTGGSAPRECSIKSDCVPAGPKCCDCPTHAVPAADPTQKACAAVDCAPMQCGSPMEADCVSGRCELVCSPVRCEASVSC